MNTFLLAALIAVGPVISPKQLSDWQKFGRTADYLIEVDINSVEPVREFGAIKIAATVKRTLNQQIPVDGKLVTAFYVDHTVSNCTDDTITILSSALFAGDKKLDMPGTELGTLANPHEPDSFVTEFLKTICSAVTKNNRSGLTT